jgi:pimeloyl-ACP methyl ester carboxylesterase
MSVSQAINLITRPPRGGYNPKSLGDIPVSPDQPEIKRVPVSFLNSNGVTILGSIYFPNNFQRESPLCCVIYLHGNAGTQVEGRFMVKYLAPKGIASFCFDFSGSGESGGDIVTLGLNEKQDVIDACDFLRKSFEIDKYILWGRSMGAATTFLAAGKINGLLGFIADSPYQSTTALFKDLAGKVKIPAFIQGPALWYVKNKVNEKLEGNILDVSPEQEAAMLTLPIIIGHCALDSFIPYHQAQHLYDVYKGEDKTLIPLPFDHNSNRPIEWLETCFSFICRLVGIRYEENGRVAQVPPPASLATDQHFRSFEEMVQHSQLQQLANH